MQWLHWKTTTFNSNNNVYIREEAPMNTIAVGSAIISEQVSGHDQAAGGGFEANGTFNDDILRAVRSYFEGLLRHKVCAGASIVILSRDSHPSALRALVGEGLVCIRSVYKHTYINMCGHRYKYRRFYRTRETSIGYGNFNPKLRDRNLGIGGVGNNQVRGSDLLHQIEAIVVVVSV